MSYAIHFILFKKISPLHKSVDVIKHKLQLISNKKYMCQVEHFIYDKSINNAFHYIKKKGKSCVTNKS